MCTVTFIPVNDNVFITHNRDEKKARVAAIPPAISHVHGHRLLFPTDKKAGGTWIAINENGNTAVLLNGGFFKHTPAPRYRKSRGLVFLDLIASVDMESAWIAIDLHGIEPFTIIMWDNFRLSEGRWDGERKHFTQLNKSKRHIWSSVTLYDEPAIAKRNAWFHAWQQLHPVPSIDDIIHFHLHGGEGDNHNDLRINRHNFMLTVSLTTLQISKERGVMTYVDFNDSKTYLQEIHFLKDTVENQ